jgi:hypothetical protein
MAGEGERGGTPKTAARFLGSLRDALKAAGQEDEDLRLFGKPQAAATPAAVPPAVPAFTPPPIPPNSEVNAMSMSKPKPPSAEEAAREARGGAPLVPPLPVAAPAEAQPAPPTTRVHRATPAVAKAAEADDSDPPVRTKLARGKQTVDRQAFVQDPVVGWLVVIGGPGLGAFRPIFEGNNTLGRASTQRIPIDFGDDTISSEEQAYIRYDSADRGFLFVPNLAKTNVVSVNDKKPTTAVPLAAMDLITIGRTQLVFVPFCGRDFDWAELAEMKG